MVNERDFIAYLEDFNRKERFILLNHVLGQQGEDAFSLNRSFRERLEDKLGLGIRPNAFVAMDYHLDWIQMALHLAYRHDSHATCIANTGKELIEANQEDVDLLVAFKEENGAKIHVLLIEAKADTGWTNKQLKSKAGRLGRIFDKRVLGVVEPHFVLMSRKEPSTKLETKEWPGWMRANGPTPWHWLELPLRDGLLKVTRCDQDENSNKEGDYLLIRQRKNQKWISAFPN